MMINVITALVVAAMGVYSANTTVCNAELGGKINCAHLGLTSATIVKSLNPVLGLDLDKNLIQNLPNNSFHGLKQLQFLYLNGNRLKLLPGTLFQGLTRLSTLELGENAIQHLPENLFHGLKQLQILHLFKNQIKVLQGTLFQGLTHLRQLTLFDNQIKTLPSAIFHGLTSLESLFIDRNRIKVLPDTIFYGLFSLRTLSMDGNPISILPDGIFIGLTQLRHVSFAYNVFQHLPENLYHGLKQLQILNLFSNQIKVLPCTLLQGLTHLVQLALMNNQIKALPRAIFHGLTSLERLFVNSNRIKVLPDTIFHGLINLRTLNIGQNVISILPDAIFIGLTQLRYVNLDNNPLTSAPKDLIQGLPKLEELHLYQTHIKNLDCEGFNEAITGDVCFGLDLARFKGLQLCSLPNPPSYLMGAGVGVNGNFRVATYAKQCLPGSTLEKTYIYECTAEGIFKMPPKPRCTECSFGTYGEHCAKYCNCRNGQECDPVNGTCLCDTGFNGTDCGEEIDECMNGDSCPGNSQCFNTYGSFDCVCEVGYSVIGEKCVTIDLPSTRASNTVELSAGAIAGITAGVVLLLVIAVAIFAKLHCTRKQMASAVPTCIRDKSNSYLSNCRYSGIRGTPTRHCTGHVPHNLLLQEADGV